ncbi:hypothetical protein ACIQI7_23700 [Kitasatospora sp. NPDC092039]|uniref:hypothetical protein n=1 Tax=Kitasatospora sp. NPDC092039 TaxID=3364086 RepID=UPI003800A0CD
MITSDVKPEDLASYLRGAGWTKLRSGALAELWAPTRGEAGSILVPLAIDAPDYGRTLDILTRELSLLEHRPVSEIQLEISRQFLDVTDLRAEDDDIDQGTISIEAGLGLFSAANRLMVSAAAATLHRQGHYGKSMPKKAYEHARRLRLGQTRPGSYVVPVISNARFSAAPRPVDVDLQLDIQAEESYFDRRVLATLSRSLETLAELTMNRDRTPTRDEVRDSVGDGVSVELCAAVLEVVGKAKVEILDVTFNWAPGAPVPTELRRNVTFARENVVVLENVRGELEEGHSNIETVLYGVIRKMGRRQNEEGGKVSLDTVIDGRKRQVSFDLGPKAYRDAAQCHGERRPVVVTGILDAPPGRPATMEVRSFAPDNSVMTL